MKGWGYLLALVSGVFGGWIAQQFWSSASEVERQAAKSATARAELRLQSLERRKEQRLREQWQANGDPMAETDRELEDLFDPAQQVSVSRSESGMLAGPIQHEASREVKELIEAESYLEAVELMYERRVEMSYDQEALYQKQIFDHVEEIEAMLQEKLQWETLIALYRLLVSLHPEHTPYTLKLVHWLIELKRFEMAEQQLQLARNDVVFRNQVAVLQDRIDERRQIQQAEGRAISLKRVGQHFLAEVVLNGDSRAELLLDTGATLSVIKASLAEDLGLDQSESEPVQMKTANGEITARKLKVDQMAINDLVLEDVALGVVPLPGFKHDGLLGMNVLGRFKFFIDQEQSVLYLSGP